MRNKTFLHRLCTLTTCLLITACGMVSQPVLAADKPTSDAADEGHFLPDGSFYQGDIVQGKPHGFGTRVYRDGRRYSGHFKSGQMHGIGVMLWPGGDRYEGAWLEDLATGSGVLRFADGSLYRGQFRNGVPHGKGNFSYATGGQYEGYWHHGSQHGKGKMTYADGGYYEGTFLNGQRHGEGLLVTAQGDRYQGPFREDQRHGEGRCGTADTARPCRYHHDKLAAQAAPVQPRRAQDSSTTPLDAVAVHVPDDIPDDLTGLYEDAQAITDTADNLELDIITLPALGELPALGVTTATSAAPVLAPARPRAKPAPDITPVPAKPLPIKTPTPGPADVATRSADTHAGAQFGEKLNQALETMKPVYRLEDLTADISEIRFHHDSPVLDAKVASAKIDWNKKRALLGSRLDIAVEIGDVSFRVELPYEGPGEYQLKSGWLVYREDDSEFRCEQPGDCLLTVVEDNADQVSGRFELTLQQQKRRFPETRVLENGVFVLRPARYGSR